LNETIHRLRLILYLLLAFLAGCILTGLFFNRQRFANIGRLDKRYANEHARTAETIGRLEEELGRERDINRQLREHNTRARKIAGELTGAVKRNVRNLQEAVGLIGEIRAKLKVLENFYNNSDPGNGGN
jgi:succinate dehydrogenase/fumarate reductase flavoprotein subunit